MKLDELKTLADAASEEITNPKGRLHYFSTKFYNAANPEAIKQLIALVRLQHEALTRLDMTGIKYNESPVDAVGRMRGIAQEALTAFDAFEKGEMK